MRFSKSHDPLQPPNTWTWPRRFRDRASVVEYFSAAERRYLLSLVPAPQDGHAAPALAGLRDKLEGGDTILIACRVHASVGGSDPAHGFDPAYKAPDQRDDVSCFIARWLPTIAGCGLLGVAFWFGLLVH